MFVCLAAYDAEFRRWTTGDAPQTSNFYRTGDQTTRRLASQQTIRILADLSHDRFVIPWRMADEMLEPLRAPIVNHARHRGEGAVVRLRQSPQIAPCDRRAVARPGAEEPTVAVDEGYEGVRNPFDQRSGQISFEHTVT
jgi:hypothetical protein